MLLQEGFSGFSATSHKAWREGGGNYVMIKNARRRLLWALRHHKALREAGLDFMISYARPLSFVERGIWYA